MPQTVTTQKPQPWASLLAVVLVVGVIWAGKAVLLPLAVGLILAFILTPLVRLCDRMRLPRFMGVALTMLLAIGVVGGVGYVTANQFAELSTQMTQYTASMRKKVSDLKMGNDAALRQFTRAVDRVTEQLDDNAAEQRRAQPVRVVPARATAWERLEHAAVSIFEPLASAVIVLALVAFLLGQREDLRDRIIRLTGSENVTMTTRLMDEAAQRVSRYLVAQLLINIGFGALITAGLYWIGVPYAALWGGLTAVLRFVPYVGTVLSALLPALLAFAVFPGWIETIQTLGLFIVMDVVAAYAVEPIVFGYRTGVSSFALLISALFWIWVWGPAGLLLATPLTVCIAVLGRHVRSLRFLAVIFADEPALMPYVRYYQRLLARDEDEAATVVERKRAQLGPVDVMDQVLIPATFLAVQHCAKKEITSEDLDYVLDFTMESAQQLSPSATDKLADARVLGWATHGAADRLALDTLQLAAGNKGMMLRTLDAELSFEQALDATRSAQLPLLCVVALSPSAGAEARKFCRRIRAQGFGPKILILRPRLPEADAAQSVLRMKEAGADCVASSISEALSGMEQLLAAAGQPSQDHEVELAPTAREPSAAV